MSFGFFFYVSFCMNLILYFKLTILYFVHFPGCFVCCFLCWQSSNCLWLSRQDHQIVEHLGWVQIHHPRRWSLRLGILRTLLPQPLQPHHCLLRLGSHRQGLELGQLQVEEQPPRPQRVLEHRYRFSWRFPLHIWWQGLQGSLVGFEWRQELVHFGTQRHHQCLVLLTQPLLVVRRLRSLYQDLGFGMQEDRRRAPPRHRLQWHQGRPTPMFVLGLVHRWPNLVCRLLRQHHPRMASLCFSPLKRCLAASVALWWTSWFKKKWVAKKKWR